MATGSLLVKKSSRGLTDASDCNHEIVDHDSETQTASCRTFGVP